MSNNIILFSFLGLLALSLFFAGTMTGLLNDQYREDAALAEMDWVFPLGMYDRIQIAEAQGEVGFKVESASWSVLQDRYYELLDEEGKPMQDDWFPRDADTSSRMELKVHPAGYYVVRDENNEANYIVNLRGEHLTWFHYGTHLELTEVPGYAIDRNSGKVIAIKEGNDVTVYEPDSGERVVNQLGDFWLMEKDLTWTGSPLTVYYLRDMDFQVALDGMLFDGIYDIDSDRIAACVITSGTLYRLPEEEISVDWRVMNVSGDTIYPMGDDEDVIMLGADEGYWFAMEDHEHRKIYFNDGTEPIDFVEDARPVGPCRNGLFVFQNEDGKYGVMRKDGIVAAQPLFDNMSPLHQNMAVVVNGGRLGVIRLKGGEDS